MSKLAAALAWAARGFRVFPLSEGRKEPAFEGSWLGFATDDPDTIRRYWTDPVLGTERDYNVGLDTTGHVVVDIDCKFGKDGYNQYMQLGASWDTLTVRTPSGGFHLYFEGADVANAAIAKDVDIRSHHGYVAAPGSELIDIPGEQVAGTYEVVNEREAAWLPLEVERLTRSPYERGVANGHAIESEAGVQGAINFLVTTPPAIQGQRGDEVTFVTAAKLVREFALSTQTAFELLRDYWNERCIPPWSLDELAQKVENAANYGSAELGRLDPSVLYSAVSPDAILPPPTIFEQGAIDFGNATAAGSLPPRPWKMDRLLMQRELTAIVAPGGTGKSTLGIAIAAHMVLGKPFGPYKVHGACRVILYNGEDDRTEQSRRLVAVCIAYGLDFEQVSAGIMFLDSDDIDLTLAVSQNRQVVAREETVKQLIDIAVSNNVGLIILDPLVDVHEVDESDNPQMNRVMGIMRRVARSADLAVLLMHHTTKSGTSKQEDRIGNADIARGAGGIVNKVRMCFTLLNASSSDCQDFGLEERERPYWVRLDDAKLNYSVASGINAEPILWFKKEGVKLVNGDVVGVLRHTALKVNRDDLKLRVADMLIGHMQVNNKAHMYFREAIPVTREREQLFAMWSDVQIRNKLEAFFVNEIEIRGMKFAIVRDNDGKNPVFVLS